MLILNYLSINFKLFYIFTWAYEHDNNDNAMLIQYSIGLFMGSLLFISINFKSWKAESMFWFYVLLLGYKWSFFHTMACPSVRNKQLIKNLFILKIVFLWDLAQNIHFGNPKKIISTLRLLGYIFEGEITKPQSKEK